MKEDKHSSLGSWIAEKRKQRGRRALERQLDYQENKAEELKGQEKEFILGLMRRTASIRQRLEKYGAVSDDSKILEVGSGAHGLIFCFGKGRAVGIDPLAVDYKRLFPKWQASAQTIAATGERLPFADSSFDLVLSDNVIDHAENPIAILKDISRVLKPSGLLYFTVNVHHPIYSLASAAHGLWNFLGIRYEISPFADHTAHFTENRIKKALSDLPLKILHESSDVSKIKAGNKSIKADNAELLIKKVFFKNALFEVIASRT
jgi:SAM-dependent methyltransferase